MQVIRRNLKEMQDKDKSYENKHRVFKEFQIGEHVYMHIKPKRSSLRIGSCAKMAPPYCGPSAILERIGLVSYQLALL